MTALAWSKTIGSRPDLGQPKANGFVPYSGFEPLAGGIAGLYDVHAIWALIELGLLRGTTGPNAYGNDPLADDLVQPALGELPGRK
jgi:hypothetical protein